MNIKNLNIFKNEKTTLLFCILLTFFIAIISNNYEAPKIIYNILNNSYIKFSILVIIILISNNNLQLGLLIALCFIFLYESYNNQEYLYKENFLNISEIMEKIEKNKDNNDELEGFQCYKKFIELN